MRIIEPNTGLTSLPEYGRGPPENEANSEKSEK